MDDKLYALMNWPEIEALIYSEHDIPHQILGQHIVEDGILVQAYMPEAKDISLYDLTNEHKYRMECIDTDGFFAALIPEKKKIDYIFEVLDDTGTATQIRDPYNYDSMLLDDDIKRFNEGIHYEVYNILGAHVKEVDGVKGVLFAVWAPEAVRVSVVGDFNHWDGRRHPMRRLGESGIHELFIPGLEQGDIYKYEIKIKGNTVVLKADPYGTYCEKRPATASIIYDLSNYEWNDSNWMALRDSSNVKDGPMLIYEVHLGGFRKPGIDAEADFYSYRELAPMIAGYVKDMGYTHIELMPVMEHPLDASWGYQVTGYYAPTSRYGTPDDFTYFMDYMHGQGIGVILDWVPAHFPRDIFGLASFDGSCLYEHKDPRQGFHPHWGTLIYNYGRPEVRNFLIANALYWVEKFHADGIRMDAVASMLYLDYGKNDGEWVANMYGGNENLEAIEFLKHLNSILKKRNKSVLSIAEESTAWPKVTTPVEDGGLGFDLKWNMGWMNDFTGYMKLDPLFRKDHYGDLLFSMIYTYSEDFILVLSHDEVVHMKGTIVNKMPGEIGDKFANLRVAYGFMAAHPGKKLLFMGQEFGHLREFSEDRELDWNLLGEEIHRQTQTYTRDLNKLYQSHPALYQYDFVPDGFEWINNFSADESIVVFLRKTETENETLMVICNFTPVVRKDYKVGVPFKGKYKEIFNSDAVAYGGAGNVNPRLKQSKLSECDGKDESIRITVPPLGISIFSCTHLKEAKRSGKPAEEKTGQEVKKAPVRKVTDKKRRSEKIADKRVPAKKITDKEPAVKKITGKAPEDTK